MTVLSGTGVMPLEEKVQSIRKSSECLIKFHWFLKTPSFDRIVETQEYLQIEG